jgi:hypothetical protein
MRTSRLLLVSAVAGVMLAAFSLQAADKKKAAGGWQIWFKDGLGDAKVVSGTAQYRVENGVLIGTTVDGSPNSFLIKGPYRDFELEFEVNVDDQLNSGVQVRSRVMKEGDPMPPGTKAKKAHPPGRVFGPQCEIAVNGTAGDFYDEARRAVWWSDLTSTREKVRTPAALAAFKKGEWNKYRIVVKGDHYQSWVNGVLTADFSQPNDPEGFIGFQVHGIKKGSGPYSVRWRNIRFRETK